MIQQDFRTTISLILLSLYNDNNIEIMYIMNKKINVLTS